MNPISQLNHEGEFERAWADPSNTRFELPPVDAGVDFIPRALTQVPQSFFLWPGLYRFKAPRRRLASQALLCSVTRSGRNL